MAILKGGNLVDAGGQGERCESERCRGVDSAQDADR
jgi:hypothetical protein